MDIHGYQASFDILIRDTEEILEFVEPVDSNAQTYSHRIYGALLRVCTDFESLAKDLLIAAGSAKAPRNMNVTDYSAIETKLRLEAVEVEFFLWRPADRRVSPFKGWSAAQPPLRWYADYNDVKHNRNAQFAKANLGTYIEALSGLFALIAKASDYEWDPSSWGRRDNGCHFWRAPFCMYVQEVEEPGTVLAKFSF